MPDIIQLLPDAVANQIAAGEVIQRPASVVKELMENAVDAGADSIKIIIKDAGKTLIQVIDNGCGMSETDLRLSVERHATSKIKNANDLFAIRTMGFRGEAMASIAAIAHLEIKSKRNEDEIGTVLTIEGTTVTSQEPCTCANGTIMSIKNLFYNVPARRKFLKKDNIEFRHISEEFQRIALVYPDISFSLLHNGRTIFQLPKSTLKIRLVNVFHKTYSERLIPVESDTSLINIKGFIGKPEFARKQRGEQFFFVNGRYIKHPYFNHAVENGFSELLPKETFPSFFLYLDVPPDKLDVNIHPTKTEVNFQDRKAIYSIIASAVKQSIGKHNITPSIDFEADRSMDVLPLKDLSQIKPPQITIDPDYNPFKSQGRQSSIDKSVFEKNTTNWQSLYDLSSQKNIQKNLDFDSDQEVPLEVVESNLSQNKSSSGYIQVAGKYIMSNIKSGLMIIDQNSAHERILYEKLLVDLEHNNTPSQQQLFPQNVNFSSGDSELVNKLKPQLFLLGFDIEPMGNNTFVINGTPSDMPKNEDINHFLDSVLENFKKNQIELKNNKKVNLALSLARNMALKPGKTLLDEEIRSLIDRLFACQMPDTSPSGKRIIYVLSLQEIESNFNK